MKRITASRGCVVVPGFPRNKFCKMFSCVLLPTANSAWIHFWQPNHFTLKWTPMQSLTYIATWIEECELLCTYQLKFKNFESCLPVLRQHSLLQHMHRAKVQESIDSAYNYLFVPVGPFGTRPIISSLTST